MIIHLHCEYCNLPQRKKIRPEPPPTGSTSAGCWVHGISLPPRGNTRIHYYEELYGPMTKERCFDDSLEPYTLKGRRRSTSKHQRVWDILSA